MLSSGVIFFSCVLARALCGVADDVPPAVGARRSDSYGRAGVQAFLAGGQAPDGRNGSGMFRYWITTITPNESLLCLYICALLLRLRLLIAFSL